MTTSVLIAIVTVVAVALFWLALRLRVLRPLGQLIQDQKSLSHRLEAAHEALRIVNVAMEAADTRTQHLEADLAALELRGCRMS